MKIAEYNYSNVIAANYYLNLEDKVSSEHSVAANGSTYRKDFSKPC